MTSEDSFFFNICAIWVTFFSGEVPVEGGMGQAVEVQQRSLSFFPSTVATGLIRFMHSI